jgi:hypothetical protein
MNFGGFVSPHSAATTIALVRTMKKAEAQYAVSSEMETTDA